MLLIKYAVQSIDGRWLTEAFPGSYHWEYERHLRTLFNSESDIERILTAHVGSGDYDIVKIFVVY